LQIPHQKCFSFSSSSGLSSLKAKPISQPTKGDKNNPQARTTHMPVLSSFLDKRIIFKIQKTKGFVAKRGKKH
jgi:hypothetical protein